MRNTILAFFLLAVLPQANAQNPAVDKAYDALVATMKTLALGAPQADFYKLKPSAPKPDNSMTFRDEVLEKVEKDGLTSITYYFDGDGARPLYEFILEFAEPAVAAGVGEKMFGAPNYPEQPDHWIVGAQGNLVKIAWVLGNKLVLAANIPGSEWDGNALFSIPSGFELHTLLAKPSEWPAEDLVRFFESLEKQITAALTNFETIRGEETDGFYSCNAPLATAETSNIFKDDQGKWTASNTLVSSASAENAKDWKADMAAVLSAGNAGKFKFKPISAKAAFGGNKVERWMVVDNQNRPAGILTGLLQYEFDSEGLWNIDVLVMQE